MRIPKVLKGLHNDAGTSDTKVKQNQNNTCIETKVKWIIETIILSIHG
jgi:hypothetical protein